MKTSAIAAAALALLHLSGAIAAPIPGLFNTGVDDDGNLLPGNGAVDPHYTITLSPDPALPGPDAVTLTPGFPVGPWIAEGPDSRWIAPATISANGNEGEWRYQISFDLTGFNEATASITGEWAVDNGGVDILLNGNSTGNFNDAGFGGFTPFTIPAGFIDGVNTLEFIVSNAPSGANPTGLRVKVRGTVEVPGEPPSISQPPNDVIVFEEQPFSLSVIADGAAPLSYQWALDGTDIPGATADTYDVVEALPEDAGAYTVTVTNAFGTAASEPPTIVAVAQPLPGLFPTGVDASRTVLADGEIDPHYQIVVNPNTESPDAIVEDSTVFPIVDGPWLANDEASKWIGPDFDTTGSAGGDYTYRLTVDLTGFDPATAFIEGTWATDNAGLDILINGTATGNVTTAQFNSLSNFRVPPGSFISGLNTVDFVLNNASVGYTGLRVAEIVGGAVPGSGGDGAPVIVRQPIDQMAEIGAQAQFSVLADGARPLSYQWRFGGVELGGATGSELTIFNVSEASAGQYDVIVTNAQGMETSTPATLAILRRPPEILTQPADQFAAPGETATFSVVADGTMPIQYQWRMGGVDMPGEQAAALVISPVGEADAGVYDVVLTNVDGELTSEPASLTVLDRVTTVFSTGVDESGTPLADNEVDPHYVFTASANANETDALAMGGIPGAWVANSATSRWIGPTPDTNGAPGLYTFQTSFDLRGFDPETVILAGSWTSDNAGLAVRLNGVATGITGIGNFGVLNEFTITDGFISGINTLEFDVENAGAAANPIGLRIDGLQALGVAVAVPEFIITSISGPSGDPLEVTLTWNSTPGAIYRLDFSRDLNNWLELDDSIASQGDMTTYTASAGGGEAGRVFYRVILLP
ncbi:MAG: immunoglobulin domain-containing protein [Verrucomicrobiales bacterium]